MAIMAHLPRGVVVTNPVIVITRHRSCSRALALSRRNSTLVFHTHRVTRMTTTGMRRMSTRCCSSSRNSGIPTPEEDKEVMHEAFLHAFEISRPEQCRIPGMQEFASAILAREKIPSQQYSDPLGHIFDEVDSNGDSVLSASEVGEALRSHDIEITDDQVAMFMRAMRTIGRDKASLSSDEQEVCVEKKYFRDLIVHMAAADFQCTQLCENAFDSETVTSCTFESDDDVQRTLEAWRTRLLHSGVIPTATVSMSGSSTDSSSSDE